MQYRRCKCGKSEAWGSMPPPRCAGCPECGTNFALGPDAHKPPEPHEFKETKVDTDDGKGVLTICLWCGETKKEIEAKNA